MPKTPSPTTGKTPLWKSIAETLKGDIASGHYNAGDKLPTEAVLASRFGVNRHTVRRALGDLGERGIVHSRRGAGVFVLAETTDYPIGRRVRFHQNLRAAGRLPGKTILALETRLANAQEQKTLELAPQDRVHVYDGLSLANNVPVALFQSIFPAPRFPNILQDLQELRSVTAALKRAGIPDYIRRETRMNAQSATATQALHLNLQEGDPMLTTTSLNVDMENNPIEMGRTWFAGDRITLVLESETNTVLS